MKQVPEIIIFTFVSGFICWLPSLMFHFISGEEFGGFQTFLITIFMPAVAIIAGYLGKEVVLSKKSEFAPLYVLAGIWVLGPLAMTINAATASGSDFTLTEDLGMLGFQTLLFPLFTFIMSMYDGSLGGILITIMSLGVMFVIWISKKE